MPADRGAVEAGVGEPRARPPRARAVRRADAAARTASSSGSPRAPPPRSASPSCCVTPTDSSCSPPRSRSCPTSAARRVVVAPGLEGLAALPLVSLTHAHGHAAAFASLAPPRAGSGVGIDVEPLVSRPPGFAQAALDQAERRLLEPTARGRHGGVAAAPVVREGGGRQGARSRPRRRLRGPTRPRDRD